MHRVMKTVCALVLCSLAVAVPSIWAYWIQDGVAICTATGTQNFPNSVSDGSGGAIVIWGDYRNGNADIYAQRVSALGVAQWTADGVAICTETNGQEQLALTSDDAGGAIVAWHDDRNGGYDIYAQRVDASGAVQWAADGVAICTATGNQTMPAITSDGAGGAIVTWQDERGGNSDIYAQRVDASGTVQWTVNGVVICPAIYHQLDPQIASDGSGGAIVAWMDERSGNYDIYARRVNASGTVQWISGGVSLCTATQNQEYPAIISDGTGGAIVSWRDERNGSYDIYAQRVNASGAVQWMMDGVAICTATNSQWFPTLVSDGAGGAIVAWHDERSGNYDIYAQHIDASGAVQWTVDGVIICTATGTQIQSLPIISDDAGGAIVSWTDERSGNYDIYVQRVDASGAIQWTFNGVALCTATQAQKHASITSNSVGGAIAAWDDYRSGDLDIYVHSIDHYGNVSGQPLDILAVQDVAGDQGGWLRVIVTKSELDDELESAYPISMYNVWQRIDDPAMLAMIAEQHGDAAAPVCMAEARLRRLKNASSISSWPIKERNGRFFIDSGNLLSMGELPPGTWELLGSFAACQQDVYIYRASTLADSTGSGIPYSVYIVSAHTTTPSVWFVSDPDSGYSVDNLPPEPPEGLAGEQSFVPEGLALSWDVSVENDLSHYVVYRGLSEDFVPSPENRIAAPLESEYLDEDWRWHSGYYYKISVLDVHGNESGFALLSPDNITGVETPASPRESYVAQNFPNPFNPTTRIAFGLSGSANVSLRIYDVAGRLVRTLAEGNRPAGHHAETWDGRNMRGEAMASGIYFYRLDAGAFTQTKKMILLR